MRPNRTTARAALLALPFTILLFNGCVPALPTAALQPATVLVHAITPATVRLLTVEVSGPGIAPSLLVNLPVGADSAASGTISVPAGSARRFVVTAVDTAGVATHRGDTTLTLQPGVAAPLAIVMRPITSAVTVTVTFAPLIAFPPAPLALAAHSLLPDPE